MSREERRAYQRQMKNMERGPALPPAARQRAERNAARRERRTRGRAEPAGAFSRGWLIRSVLIAVAVGFIAFSLQWPEMPWAAYVGAAVGLVTLGLLAGFRLLRRRMPMPPGT